MILTDLIENFEPRNLPFFMRPLVRLAGIAAPHGAMPRDMRWTFRGHHDALRAAIERMIAWEPERIVISHGDWFRGDAVGELRRAFRFLF